MTIRDLLELVLPSSPRYDPPFAKMFRSLVKRVLQNRERVNAAPPGDYKPAKKYLESWAELLDLFADDPRSLAALTAPKVKIKGKAACLGGTDRLFPTTIIPPTVILFLYFLEPGYEKPKGKPKPASAKSRKASKKR